MGLLLVLLSLIHKFYQVGRRLLLGSAPRPGVGRLQAQVGRSQGKVLGERLTAGFGVVELDVLLQHLGLVLQELPLQFSLLGAQASLPVLSMLVLFSVGVLGRLRALELRLDQVHKPVLGFVLGPLRPLSLCALLSILTALSLVVLGLELVLLEECVDVAVGLLVLEAGEHRSSRLAVLGRVRLQLQEVKGRGRLAALAVLAVVSEGDAETAVVLATALDLDVLQLQVVRLLLLHCLTAVAVISLDVEDLDFGVLDADLVLGVDCVLQGLLHGPLLVLRRHLAVQHQRRRGRLSLVLTRVTHVDHASEVVLVGGSSGGLELLLLDVVRGGGGLGVGVLAVLGSRRVVKPARLLRSSPWQPALR